MTIYGKYIYPFLDRRDAESNHVQVLWLLRKLQSNLAGRAALRLLVGSVPNKPIKVFGLSFPNLIGLAAGFDKDAQAITGLALLGFGHVEVGTLTPRLQVGNEKPRVFRLTTDRAVINRMGFPNCGVNEAVQRLKSEAVINRSHVLGVSLGKQKESSLNEAVEDYIEVMRAVYAYTDYLAVNISSPNTPGLRKLQGKKYLHGLLECLQRESRSIASCKGLPQRPILVKISPDLTRSGLDDVLDVALANNISGIIATNTTSSREPLVDKHRSELGGLSGAPLKQLSNKVISHVRKQAGDKLPIIGVGGVFTADDVLAKLDSGATLVQVYTGLIYQGPAMVGQILRELQQISKASQF